MSYTMMCAIFHILGVYLVRILGLTDIYAISLSGIILTAITGIIRKNINPMLLIAFIMLSSGATSYSITSDNKLYNQFPDKYVTVTGTVISSPIKSNSEYCNKYILKPESVSYLDTTVKSTQRLYVRTKIPYRYGDMKTFTGSEIPFSFDDTYDNVKVMVWDNLTNLKPVCDVENVQ